MNLGINSIELTLMTLIKPSQLDHSWQNCDNSFSLVWSFGLMILNLFYNLLVYGVWNTIELQMERVSSTQKTKKKIFNFVINKLGSILPFRGLNCTWKSEPLHLNNWSANLGFALCNQFNQVDQMRLIKAHPFLLSSNCIYQ